jgi:hypothetical protein
METRTYDSFSPEALRELVVDFHLKDSTIASIFHVTSDAVLKRRNSCNLPRGASFGEEIPVGVVFTGRDLRSRRAITIKAPGSPGL